MRTMQDLQQLQGLPLSLKIRMTKERIRQWINEYGEDGVYVSFSGGKDSTVLLHLVREDYPNVKAVFVDTGLEFPEIRQFVKTFDNVEWLKPKMGFKQVIQKYGYPFISKEVSECVYGARKYLTSILQDASLDRPTDRPTDRTGMPTRELLEQAHTRSIEQGTHHPYHYETDKILGTCRQGEYHPKFKGGTTASIVNSEEFRSFLEKQKKKDRPGSLRRIAILTGMFTKDCQIKANIPEKDRSRFSQEHYQFFLDAPFEISSRCCDVMKKGPAHLYQKKTGRKPMTAQMASESRLRAQKWLMNGCNGFNLKSPISNPMAFWTEQDVLLYIYQTKLPICSVYGEIVKDQGEIDGQMDLEDYFGKELFDLERPTLKTTGCDRTGCMFCGYGCHLEKGEGRFVRMKRTHPKQYDYIMRPWEEGGLNYKEMIDWINEHGNLHIRY